MQELRNYVQALILILLFFNPSFTNAYIEELSSSQIKILFLGNSFTGWNEMPTMVEELAKSDGYNVYVDKFLQYGRSLYEISQLETARIKINSVKWDYVILQDSPYRFAYPIEFLEVNPINFALNTLRQIIKKNNIDTEIVLFMPWAYKDGKFWVEGESDDYHQMQVKVYENTIKFADTYNFKIAPVGWAWDKIVFKNDAIELFTPDLSHPTLEGSYLTACVIYSAVFHEELIYNQYVSDILKHVAFYLQKVATETVFSELSNWNLVTSVTNNEFDFFEVPQNYPNPFNPTTTISYSVPERLDVKIVVYNLVGEVVNVLMDKEHLPGRYYLAFKATNLSSGTYFYRVSAGKNVEVRKMILIK